MYRASAVEVAGQGKYQLVLSQQCGAIALTGLHDDIVHMGMDKTLDLVRDTFCLPRLATDAAGQMKKL